MQVYSLFELTEFLRRVVALNFPEPLWITAELAQCNGSRGHFYLDFIQNSAGEADLLAQASGVLWARTHARLRKRLGTEALDAVLREGVKVKLQVRVDFHERYGFKLIVEDIDPAYTFGQLELQRRQTIEQLRREGLLERQRALPLPRVLQRVAVISSEEAAGLQDFRMQLAQNGYGYRVSYDLFATAVQGAGLDREVRAALLEIARRKGEYDCVVVVRGGGARTDLAGFDGLELCRDVARLPLPVFTGIGHDVDETVLDLAAHTALKTPTAVAEFLLQHNLAFETEVLRLGAGLRAQAERRQRQVAFELERLETAAHYGVREKLRHAGTVLDRLEALLPASTTRILRRHSANLDRYEALVGALDPRRLLRRGFSQTFKDGKLVRAADELRPGDVLETRFGTGSVESVVIE